MDSEPPNTGARLFFFSLFPVSIWVLLNTNLSVRTEGGDIFNSIVLLFLLLACSAFFSGCEAAYFALSSTEREKLREEDSKTARYILYLLSDRPNLLATLLGMNEIVNITISLVVATIIHFAVSSASIWHQTLMGTLITLPLLLILGEVTPKSVALRNPLFFARFSAPFLRLVYFLATPLRFALVAITAVPFKVFGIRRYAADTAIGEDEFRTLVAQGRKNGDVDPNEHKLIDNVFEFTDLTVRYVMKPARNIVSIPINLSFDQLIAYIRDCRFSRLPIYRESPGNFVGLLHVKDVLRYLHSGGANKENWSKEIARKIHYVKASDKANVVLRRLKRDHVHLSLVKEGNEIIGLVTLEDLLEKVFGDITDEKESINVKWRVRKSQGKGHKEQ